MDITQHIDRIKSQWRYDMSAFVYNNFDGASYTFALSKVGVFNGTLHNMIDRCAISVLAAVKK